MRNLAKEAKSGAKTGFFPGGGGLSTHLGLKSPWQILQHSLFILILQVAEKLTFNI